ncbi:unnamed protein product [Linum tenue]|uniref:Uncharacterized protein n=1 Tax=Linum tenue TaxID=586396 RepID=A0AAV0IHI3_9ROSI|nr:unnamed protein product [Linum tenue]
MVMMVRSLMATAAPNSSAAAISISNGGNHNAAAATPPLPSQSQVVVPQSSRHSSITRRSMGLSLMGGLVGLKFVLPEGADAAARRPPPSPPAEKKDPNISGVQAKILASKKRKEAMKDLVSKLREQGKGLE